MPVLPITRPSSINTLARPGGDYRTPRLRDSHYILLCSLHEHNIPWGHFTFTTEDQICSSCSGHDRTVTQSINNLYSANITTWLGIPLKGSLHFSTTYLRTYWSDTEKRACMLVSLTYELKLTSSATEENELCVHGSVVSLINLHQLLWIMQAWM